MYDLYISEKSSQVIFKIDLYTITIRAYTWLGYMRANMRAIKYLYSLFLL